MELSMRTKGSLVKVSPCFFFFFEDDHLPSSIQWNCRSAQLPGLPSVPRIPPSCVHSEVLDSATYVAWTTLEIVAKHVTSHRKLYRLEPWPSPPQKLAKMAVGR